MTRSLAYHQLARLLYNLHYEMLTGDPDGPAADALRDEMEPHWYAMTPEETEASRDLSAELYEVWSKDAHRPQEP